MAKKKKITRTIIVEHGLIYYRKKLFGFMNDQFSKALGLKNSYKYKYVITVSENGSYSFESHSTCRCYYNFYKKTWSGIVCKSAIYKIFGKRPSKTKTYNIEVKKVRR